MTQPNSCSDKFEQALLSKGVKLIAGIDEVGRGALAGPVVASAVILDLNNFPVGLNDSKRLTKSQRTLLAKQIKACAIAVATAQVEAPEIDEINILQASFKAMQLALESLTPQPEYLLIDGCFTLKEVKLAQQAIIKGDSLSISIAAASIVAKVARDNIMLEYDKQWPAYQFAKNVGYGTPHHLATLRILGATAIHRQSFRGVLPEAQLDLPL